MIACGKTFLIDNDDKANSSAINIESAVVMFRGNVANKKQKEAVLKTAKNIKGVASVKDMLKIVSKNPNN